MRYLTIRRCLSIAILLALAGCGSSSTPQSGASGTADTSAPGAQAKGQTGGQAGGQAGAPAASAAPATPPIVVPAETVISVTLDQTIGTKNSNVGDPFAASVSTPVVVNGIEAIPHGAKAAGHVAVADQAGRVKGGAQLVLNLDSVTVNGKAYRIHTAGVAEAGKARGKRTAVGAGGGAAVGAIIGAIAGGGKGAAIGAGAGGGAGAAGAVFTGKRDVSIPAETRLRFRLTQPMEITAR
jgi:hypothetical protein